MKRILSVALILVGAAAFAAAQPPTSDVLGAHLNYGRGCAACHAPHSGAYGNGNGPAKQDATSGNIALWGEDASPLYGVTIVTGQSEHGSASETLPGSLGAGTPDVAGVLMCLSCHDGNLATGAMMQNKVYESLPSTYGTKNSIPTLLGNDLTGTNNYLNDHPVGMDAVMTCGGTYDWDCSIDATGAVKMTGTGSAAFVKNYGFFVRPAVNAAKAPVVMCTTCHNQHVMNVVNVKAGATNTGLAAGPYTTMFFLRGPYNPGNTSKNSNSAAQFCRQCHGGEANEMNGSLTIPTVI